MTRKPKQSDIEMLQRLLVRAKSARDAGNPHIAVSTNEARNVQRLINYVVERGFEAPPEVQAAAVRLGFKLPKR